MYHMHTFGASKCMHVVHSVGFAIDIGLVGSTLQRVNQIAAKFLQRVAGHFNAMDVNNCKRIPKSLEARWRLIELECSLYQGYFVTTKAFKESEN